MKIGLFGGTFNPPHIGHLNSLETVRKKLGLEKIYVIPNNTNPLKKKVEGPNGLQRLEMAKKCIQGYEKYFEVDSCEVDRGGVSYTIDTVSEYRRKYTAKQLFLIIGADNLNTFDKWKNYEQILSEINLVVTTRPGYEIPTDFDELPAFLKPLTREIEFNFIELKSERSIQFVSLNDVEISSTELRKKLRTGRPITKFLPLALENYIKSNNLYKEGSTKVSDYKKFTHFCAQILADKKAIGIIAYDLTKISAPAEYTLVASGTSNRHAVSLAESILLAVKEEFNLLPQSYEGMEEGRWVVVDYGSLIIHVFYDFVRQEYSLEKLWSHAQILSLDTK